MRQLDGGAAKVKTRLLSEVWSDEAAELAW